VEGGEHGEYVINSSCGTMKTSNWKKIRKWEYNTARWAMYI
jgi:hypothetical protein